MIFAFSFCHKDHEQALKQARWIKELGGIPYPKVVVFNDLAKDYAKEIMELLGTDRFLKVADNVDQKWPQAPNNMFQRFNKEIIQGSTEPFLWMEPDAIPLTPDWADRIHDEYVKCQKPFMGDRVIVEEVPEHMSGVAVYRELDRLAWYYITASNIAWDVVAASQIIPQCHYTTLIQHEWKPESFPTQESLKRIRKGAVIYHQNKDGSLIDRLREINGLPEPQAETLNSGATDTVTTVANKQEPVSITDQIKALCASLNGIVDGKPGRQKVMLDELRKLKIIPQARKR